MDPLTLAYQKAGGTLSNSAIPTSYIDPITNKTASQTGQEAFRRLTGKEYVPTAPISQSSGGTPQKKASSTVISNANIIEDTIPEDNSRLASLSNKGATVGADGILRNADGSLVAPPNGAEQGKDGNFYFNGLNYGNQANGTSASTAGVQEEDDFSRITKQLTASLDAETKTLIDAYHRQYEAKRQVQRDINERSLKGREQALLLGGSSRYAPLSAGGIAQAQEVYGLQEIDRLDAEEQTLIAQAKIAQSKGEREILNRLLDQAEEKRKEKQKTATDLANKQAEELKALKKQSRIMDAIDSGANDVASISKLIGKEVPIKEIKEFWDAYGSGLVDVKSQIGNILTDARQNGAPSSVISAISSSKSIEEAIRAAGNWAQTGTGISGEYLFYKRQAEMAGQIPVDFNEYQNMDANRKAKIQAAVNTTGLDSKQTQNFLTISNKFQADPFINNAIKGRTANTIADQVISDPASATNQLKALYVLVKNLDPDSAVREGEVALADRTQSYLSRFENTFAKINEGRVIAPEAAKELAKATKELATAWNDTAERRKKQYKAQASVAGIGDAFNSYLSASDVEFSPAQTLIDKEKQAEEKIADYILKNPGQKSTIDSLISKLEETVGRSVNMQDLLEAYPEFNQ